jgi:hypothetical protein
MTQLSALPTLSVQIAFNPTNLYGVPASQTWIDVTEYVRDFQTKSGKQHFLDRIEAATLSITFNNRLGFFSSGSTVLGPRMPIQVTATWSGVTYPIYYGIIDSVTEKVADYLNLDLAVQASDLTKYMSLRYVNYPQFWAAYARSLSAIHWYDCNITKQANVVSAVATTTVVTYTYAPGTAVTFSVGDEVTITGLTKVVGAPYNQTNVVVTGVGTGYFTTDNQVTKRTGTPGGPLGPAGNSLGQATATLTKMTDLIGSGDADLVGYGTFTNNGAIIYEVNTAIDLANGSTENTNCYIRQPNITSGLGGIDFWINGAGLALSTIIIILQGDGTNDSFYHELSVNNSGQISLSSGFSPSTSHTVSGGVVNDGYWHHVGIICDETNEVKLYCNGVFYSVPTTPGQGSLKTYGFIGEGVPAYFDEIIFSDSGSISTLAEEVQQRWKAGSLLQLGFPTTANYVFSGDRIAEILCIAGFGYVTGGDSTTQANIVLDNNPYYINDSSTPWAYGAAGNGSTYGWVEPYYWDSPVTTSTALDLILQVCDTDIGIFYQKPDGTFAFYNQNYYGSWTWDASTNKGTWSLSIASPDANHTWTDNNIGVPYFGQTLQIVRDDADLWTTVKITPQAGTDQIFENSAAEPRWGFTTLQKSSTLHTSLNLALNTATYLGFLFQAPSPRVGNVELRAETNNGAYLPAILGAGVGNPVNFQRNPSGASTAGSINANYVIESIAHDFQADPGQWHTSYILDPYPVPSTNSTPFP